MDKHSVYEINPNIISLAKNPHNYPEVVQTVKQLIDQYQNPSTTSDMRTKVGEALQILIRRYGDPNATPEARSRAMAYVIKSVTPAIWKFINKFGFSLSQPDKQEAFQRGVEKVQDTVQEYDPSIGAKFITYLYKRLEMQVLQEVKKLTDRMVSLDQEVNLGGGSIDTLLNALPLQQLQPLQRSMGRPDLIEEPEKTDPMSDAVRQLVYQKLVPQERIVVSLVYGMVDPEYNPSGRGPLTQMEVAKELGLTQVRINIILQNAFQRLREGASGETLKEFYRTFESPERSPLEPGDLNKLEGALKDIGSIISFNYKEKKVTGYIARTFLRDGKIYHRVYLPTQEDFGDQYLNVVRQATNVSR